MPIQHKYGYMAIYIYIEREREFINMLSYFKFDKRKLSWFCPSIAWCSQIDDHPPKDLAKFGYRPNMKVENPFFNLFGLGRLYPTCWKNMEKFELIFQNLANQGPFFFFFFFSQNSFLSTCWNKYFLRSRMWPKFDPQMDWINWAHQKKEKKEKKRKEKK